MTHAPSDNPAPTHREPQQSGVTLSDLTSELLWPKLFRAPALALAPSRLLPATACVFLLTLTYKLIYSFAPSEENDPAEGFFTQLDALTDRLTMLSQSLIESVFSLDVISLTESIWLSVITLRDLILQSPMISLLVCFPLISILCIHGTIISRSTSIEFALQRYATRNESLIFALRNAKHVIGASVIPVLLSGLGFLIIALAGLLLSAPIVDVVGAVLYPISLAIGLFATLLLCIHVIASPLLIPALSVEGTDGFDAVQRSYAYVIGKPIRYLSYFAILLILGVISASIFKLVSIGSISMTDWAAKLIANPSTAQALEGEGDLGATKNIAHSLIASWKAIIQMISSGYIISLFFTSATLLYMLTRRICDGQDIAEVYESKSEALG